MCSDLYGMPALALCAAILLSCTVKEDRTECPCFLTVDLGGVESAALMGKGVDSLIVQVQAEGDFYVREAFHLRDNVQEYTVAVPKTRTDVLVACTSGRFVSDAGGLHIPEGSECPVLYLSADSFVADAGEMRRTASVHRNYCVLTVSMKASFNAKPRPYRITLEGNVSGYLMDGSPEQGFFSYASSSSGGPCRLRIPDSGEVRSFSVGEYILESGYDWNAPDLEDIDVEMDFSRSSLTVSISKWKKTLSFEITI